MKINENQCKINFFRIHSVLNVDFDESYAFLLSFWMILLKCWRVFKDFEGFSNILEGFWWFWDGKSMKINEILRKWMKMLNTKSNAEATTSFTTWLHPRSSRIMMTFCFFLNQCCALDGRVGCSVVGRVCSRWHGRQMVTAVRRRWDVTGVAVYACTALLHWPLALALHRRDGAYPFAVAAVQALSKWSDMLHSHLHFVCVSSVLDDMGDGLCFRVIWCTPVCLNVTYRYARLAYLGNSSSRFG